MKTQWVFESTQDEVDFARILREAEEAGIEILEIIRGERHLCPAVVCTRGYAEKLDKYGLDDKIKSRRKCIKFFFDPLPEPRVCVLDYYPDPTRPVGHYSVVLNAPAKAIHEELLKRMADRKWTRVVGFSLDKDRTS